MDTLNLVLALAALAVASALRPWRTAAVPAWPAMACWALMPLLWTLDVSTRSPLLQPLSGIGLLVLMVGWPLTVLALVPVAGVMLLMTEVDAAGALQRVVWIGLVPATLALLLGAAIRRWLPNHLFIYILGRGFFGTALAVGGAGTVAALWIGVPEAVSTADVVVARVLAAFGDAFITGMLVAIFVAFKPHWLATYADRIYLPRT